MGMFKRALRMLVVLSLWSMAGVAFAGGNGALPASAVSQAEEPDFSPPPVPEFMLRKPAQPLTLEQMQQQADEAARKSRAKSHPPLPAKSTQPPVKNSQSDK